MSGPSRERRFALLALFAVLLICAIAPTLALSARSDALQARSDENDLLQRLIAARHRLGDRANARAMTAPAAALIGAQTPGLATAQLEAYLSSLVEAAHADLVSSSAQAADRADGPDIVRVQAGVDLDYEALQPFLYELEAGAPYVFIDSLTLRAVNAASKRGARGLRMKAILSLRAIWRQSST